MNPYIHGGLLARRELPEHMETLKEQNITPIDLVCVNLYPFKQTIENPEVTLENAMKILILADQVCYAQQLRIIAM